MRVHLRLLPILVLTLACAAPAAAQDGAADFPQLLARFQAGDTTVDVTALRMAYTRTDAYDPYDSGDMDEVRAMWEHLDGGRHAEAAGVAEKLLAGNWLEIGPHVAAMAAYDELGNDSASALHRLSIRRLLESIGGPEDGRTSRSPMRVINVSEEYAYLQLYGLQPRGQALAECGDAPCDAMNVQDEDGKRFTLYFDVDIPFQWMTRQMGAKDGDAPAPGRQP
jgi:hypothetical protein